MRDDQILRGVVAVACTVAYGVRTLVLGNGSVNVFGYAAAPFGLLLIALVVLAVPETVDKLPFGPSRAK